MESFQFNKSVVGPSNPADVSGWAVQQVRVWQAMANQVNNVATFNPGVWTDATLINNWSGTLQYKVDSGGTVMLRGAPTAIAGAGTAMCVIPLPFPGSAAYFPGCLGVDGTVGTLLAQPSGPEVTIYCADAGSTTAGGINVNEITWSTLT